jgi:hypothetical protein
MTENTKSKGRPKLSDEEKHSRYLERLQVAKDKRKMLSLKKGRPTLYSNEDEKKDAKRKSASKYRNNLMEYKRQFLELKSEK